MKCVLVCGAGGFIGNHLVSRLKQEGNWVRGVDLKYPEFSETEADDFVIGDLRDATLCRGVIDRRFDEIYQLAADMGGAGYIFTGENDAHIMHNSATINLNILDLASKRNCHRIFYSSSACMYPAHNQENTNKPVTAKTARIRPIQIANTAGKNCSASGFILLTTATCVWKPESLVTTIYSDLSARGRGDEKRRPPRSVAKSLKPETVERLKSGVMENRLVHFFLLTNAWRVRFDLPGLASLDRLTSDRRKWFPSISLRHWL